MIVSLTFYRKKLLRLLRHCRQIKKYIIVSIYLRILNPFHGETHFLWCVAHLSAVRVTPLLRYIKKRRLFLSASVGKRSYALIRSFLS